LGAGGGRPAAATGPGRNGTGAGEQAPLAEDLPSALAAAIVDPGRVEVYGAEDVEALEPWLRAQPSVGASLLLDDPRPRRGTALALAVASPDGRGVAADGAGAGRPLGRLPQKCAS